jgi:F-type H+-transporting ATPase subunit b
MAGESHAGEAGHEAASGGLPQFDPTYFPSQLFWLTIFFVLLYLLLDRVLLPRVGGVIEARAKKIQGDIDAAAKANADAQAALDSYDATIAASRAKARAEMDTARAEAADVRAKQTAEADATHRAALDAAEARLMARRAQGLEAAREAAEDVACDIVRKIAGQGA